MLRTLLLSVALVGLVSNQARTQVPWDCACTQVITRTFDTNVYIGWVSSNVTIQCRVVTVGSNTYCQMAGTVSYNYAPTGGFILGSAGWGAPPTAFTPPSGGGSGSFSPNPTVLCTGTTLGANIFIAGSVGGSQISIWASNWYTCNPL